MHAHYLLTLKTKQTTRTNMNTNLQQITKRIAQAQKQLDEAREERDKLMAKCLKAREAEAPTMNALFKAIARDFGVSVTAVRNVYRYNVLLK